MSPRDALNVLKQVATKYLGTLEDHNMLQEAVRVLEGVVAKAESSVVSEPSDTPEP